MKLQLNNISLTSEVNPANLKVNADERLITQVIINLIKNSIESVNKEKNGKIQIKAFISSQSETIIQVIDNGTGIAADLIDKIFIPFFTTKESGSGIGLSLSIYTDATFTSVVRLYNKKRETKEILIA